MRLLPLFALMLPAPAAADCLSALQQGTRPAAPPALVWVAPLSYAELYALVERGGVGVLVVGGNPAAAPTAPCAVMPAGTYGLAAGTYDMRRGADGKPWTYPKAATCGPAGCAGGFPPNVSAGQAFQFGGCATGNCAGGTCVPQGMFAPSRRR